MVKIGKWNVKESAIIGITEIEKEIPEVYQGNRALAVKDSPYMFELGLQGIGVVEMTHKSLEVLEKGYAKYLNIIENQDNN